ncbi:MAG: hypothetical protein Q9166_007384 [cf. Caloplaca sp. 2 TL-2023]
MSPTPASNGHPPIASNGSGPLGHSSPTAIIIAWVLTAFVPLPMISSIIIIRYFPNAIPKCLFRLPCSSERLANKRSGFSFSSNQPASTPSSVTLAASGRSSYTLPVSNLCPTTPPGQDPNWTEYPGSGTSHNSLADSPRHPITPSKSSKTTQNSSSSLRKSNLSNQPCTTFDSPKRRAFLEPPIFPSTPRKSYARLPPSTPQKPSNPPIFNSPPTLRVSQRRRLKQRFLVSVILCSLVFALYVLEGFAIAAAQKYAHVRVLSQANGKDGLGEGKEDEKWLIPWIVYVILQGGMVLGSVWMVHGLRRKLKQLDRGWTTEKGKGVEQPGEQVTGDIELQTLGAEEERYTFLLTEQDGPEDPFWDENNGKGKAAVSNEEKEWISLGFHPIFDSIEKPSSSNLPDSDVVSALQQATYLINPNGEGSSSGPSYSAGSKFEARSDEQDISISFVPKTANRRATERSKPDIELLRRSSDKRQLRSDDEMGGLAKGDRMALLREELMGPPLIGDHRNSWEQDNDEEEKISKRSKLHNGKGKEKEKENDAQTPKFDAPTGIDLDVEYKFTDGLAYPLLPLRNRKRKSTSTVSAPINPNNNDIACPFPIPIISPSSRQTPPLTPTPHHQNHRPFLTPSGKTPANILSRFPTHTPPTTPNRRQLNFQSQPPPQTPPHRSFSFSPPDSPYAPSAIFQPHWAPSPFELPPPPPPIHALSRGAAPQQRMQPAHRIPTSSPLFPARVLNTLSRSPRSPHPPHSPSTRSDGLGSSGGSGAVPSGSVPSSSPLPSLGSLRSPKRMLSYGGRSKLARRPTIGRGKRATYRRLGSGLGTVSERDVEVGGEGGGGGW